MIINLEPRYHPQVLTIKAMLPTIFNDITKWVHTTSWENAVFEYDNFRKSAVFSRANVLYTPEKDYVTYRLYLSSGEGPF